MVATRDTTPLPGRDHGTLPTYKAGCGCLPCQEVNNEYTREYHRRRARNLPTTNLVDAAPVRAHIRALQDVGVTHTIIAERTGVREGWIRYLMTGVAGRNEPAARVNELDARRALSMPVPVPDKIMPTGVKVRGDGPRRRGQALMTIGHTVVWQAEQLGMRSAHLGTFLRTPGQGITAKYARRLCDLYAEFWDKPAPDGVESRRTRTVAARRGYRPPMAWDDDLIDLPEEELAAELERRVARMDFNEVRRAYRAFLEGDRTPVMEVAAVEWRRWRLEQSRVRKQQADMSEAA